MEGHKETIIAAAKVMPAWLGAGLAHTIDSITWTVIASVAATVYSVVQTYISIQRYRRDK